MDRRSQHSQAGGPSRQQGQGLLHFDVGLKACTHVHRVCNLLIGRENSWSEETLKRKLKGTKRQTYGFIT